MNFCGCRSYSVELARHPQHTAKCHPPDLPCCARYFCDAPGMADAFAPAASRACNSGLRLPLYPDWRSHMRWLMAAYGATSDRR